MEDLPHKLWRRSKVAQYNQSGGIILDNSFQHGFCQMEANYFVDTRTKEAALTVSPSLVNLISYSGEEKICWVSGVVLESDIIDNTFISTILTSATLLRLNGIENSHPENFKVEVNLPTGEICAGVIFAFDWHYNICAIKVKSSAHLPTITVRCLDDRVGTVATNELEGSSSQLSPRSSLFKLFPGNTFIALGRYYREPYDLMVAPGKYSIDRCGLDCKELLRVNSKITKCGIGGPMINLYGEVIGINFYAENFTPVLPMNVVSKWWEFTKGCRSERYNRPWVGMQVNTLFAAPMDELEIIMRKFPDVEKGIIVEKVSPRSPAAVAGLCSNDVIIQFGGEDVQSCLQLFEISWDKVGKRVGLAVRRASTGERKDLTMVVGCVDATQFNRWKLPSERWVKTVRLF